MMITVTSTGFWSNPQVIAALVGLISCFGTLITALAGWIVYKVNTISKDAVTIKGHTNGMMGALQDKVDAQHVTILDQKELALKTAIDTARNIAIALVTKGKS